MLVRTLSHSVEAMYLVPNLVKSTMKLLRHASRKAAKRRGVLTFEWILLISILVIGIIGGLSAVRNALLCELNDLAKCVEALNTCGCSGTCVEGSDCLGAGCCDNPWWCWSCNQ